MKHFNVKIELLDTIDEVIIYCVKPSVHHKYFGLEASRESRKS